VILPAGLEHYLSLSENVRPVTFLSYVRIQILCKIQNGNASNHTKPKIINLLKHVN